MVKILIGESEIGVLMSHYAVPICLQELGKNIQKLDFKP